MDRRIPSVVPSLQELKKMIKQENINSGRLSSLRLPRDLSLGGTKPKKVYTPNLNVVRNKDKSKHVPVKGERGQKRSSDNFATNGTSSRQKNKRVKYVQSEGVFSQGMGEIKRPTHRSDKNTSVREHNNVASLVMPKINRNNWSVNKEDDAAVVSELVANVESESDSDTEYDPVILPLERNKNNFINIFKIKSEVTAPTIKKEDPDTEPNVKVPLISYSQYKGNDFKPKIKLEKTECIPEYNSFLDCTKMVDEDNPVFSVLQLPSSFPGKLWTDDPTDKNLDYTIKHMQEAQIGKICVRKSGKTEMIYKNTTFMLNGGASGGLTANAVLFPGEQSIALEPSLVTLGNVAEKYVVSPEWNFLFNRARKNRKFYW